MSSASGLAIGAALAGLLAFVAVVVTGARRVATSASDPATGKAAADPAEDAALGTLPQVPGLLDREAKEPGFVRELLRVIRDEHADGDRLAALMSEESGFNPAARNPDPVGRATGLLQWIARYAQPVTGYTVDQLREMSAIEQLHGPVRKTLRAWGAAGRADPAMAGWGSHVGAPDDAIIATKGDEFYAVNGGYDRAKKGAITVGDVRHAVYGLLDAAKTKPRIGADGRPVASSSSGGAVA